VDSVIMSFGRNNYLSWYCPRLWREGDPAIDLRSSGVAWVEPHELTLPSGGSKGMVSRFDSGLADWLGLVPPDVVFTHGATGGTLRALLTLAGRRDQLVVGTPVYEPLLRQAERLGQEFSSVLWKSRGLRRGESGGCSMGRPSIGPWKLSRISSMR